MSHFKLVTLPGDGIGPEVTSVAVDLLKAVCSTYGVTIETREQLFGGISFEKHGTPVTDETLDNCKSADAVLLGAVGGPQWDNLDKEHRPESALLRLRKELGVYANLRPVFVHEALKNSSTLRHDVIDGVDILIVRELTGGIYFGEPRYTKEENGVTYSVDTMAYSSPEIVRVAEKAFQAAQKRGSKVCSVDKANILECSRLWRKTVIDTSTSFPDVTLEHMLVDNCAMQLIRNPGQFDVLLTGNMFGDILSDEAAMLTGSIGMLPSASLGDGTGLYEPVHGSAPDIAGQDIANPLAAIASAAMLCRYSMNLEDAANSIEKGITRLLDAGYRTADLFSDREGEKLIGTKKTGQLLLELMGT